MPKLAGSKQHDILYGVLRLEFGDRMAERWASDPTASNLPPNPEDLLATFLGKSAIAALLRTQGATKVTE